mmetsp:Transcript_19228/g.25041  ORF Transcript_19228/g.25041 Transcript_19228/m.25041 type:complete len:477 (+) Transcript_19228:107-1537(+)
MAEMRKITKDMTMSDKGPGSFYRQIIEPDDSAVDDTNFRETYLNQGAFVVSARSDRSTLSFAKECDHPPWDIRSRAGNPEAQARRETFAVDLSSGAIGAHKKAAPTNNRLDIFSTDDRLRLVESGKLGDFDKTSKIHEARRMFRRQQRRELQGKKLTMSGKLCTEALTRPPDPYHDEDSGIMCKPSGPRETRVGVGSSMRRSGTSPRAELAREMQTSGEFGIFTKKAVDQHVHPQPSGRRDRFLGGPTEHRVIEPGGGKLRGTRPKSVSDLSKQASGQIGQFWGPNKEEPHDEVEGGVPHWHSYPELDPHVPSMDTQRNVERNHRDLLSSSCVGSFVSARGPKPSQAVNYNEPLGCALKPCNNPGAGFQPPLGPPTDGLPFACKPGAERADKQIVAEWKSLAQNSLEPHAKYQAFHKSAKSSLLAAAEEHSKPEPRDGQVTMTRTAREKCRRAMVDRASAADADLGWSHCLRGQKW